MKKGVFIILLFFLQSNFIQSQGKFIVQNKKGSDKLKFELINNLIVIPVEINGVKLSFLLDTGGSKPILFNVLNISDSLKIKNPQKIFLRGLGEAQPVEAIKSDNNVFKIGDVINLSQDFYAVYDANVNLAPRLGVPVHGILGFDLFKDMVVEINYSRKYIKITDPKRYRYKTCKKCERFNLEFYKNKPYINTKVEVNNELIPVKLLIDTGGSDALWLFENDTLGLVSSNKYFEDFLGLGLNGSIYGKRSKVKAFYLKKYVLKNANVAYPDSAFTFHAKKVKGRNGSVSGNILKRFNLIIDYKQALVTFKRNSRFKENFSYNNSGLELAHNGFRLVKDKDYYSKSYKTYNNEAKVVFNNFYKLLLKPAYEVVEIRTNSPAHKAGLKKGDVVLSINGVGAHKYTLQRLMSEFYEDTGKKIKLKIDRNGRVLNYTFLLENFFK